MRILGGTLKGRVIKVPPGLQVRPTTDFAKEGLFNILVNHTDFEGLRVLDLFAGTGQISFECASRGSVTTAVEKDSRSAAFIRTFSTGLKLDVQVIREDSFRFLGAAREKYNLVFADPPYEMENIPEIHRLVFEKGMLAGDGLLIIEHGPGTDLSALPHFERERKYGNVRFSFFR